MSRRPGRPEDPPSRVERTPGAPEAGEPATRISVILSTYENPEWLRKSLWGWAAQTWRDFEVVVADDGSGPDTAGVIDAARAEGAFPIRHVWQADEGFRKARILNRAIVASRGAYLVFSDGDCIPRDDFLATHARLAAPGRFLSGGMLRLPLDLSRRIDREEVRAGRHVDPEWLRERGWHPGRHRLRTLRGRLLPAILDALTPTSPTWNGHNASTWRDAVLAVNGFDSQMGYGGQDRAFGVRLRRLGLRPRQVRHRAVCVHLEHERPWRTEAELRRNREIRERIRRERRVRAVDGIAELDA